MVNLKEKFNSAIKYIKKTPMVEIYQDAVHAPHSGIAGIGRNIKSVNVKTKKAKVAKTTGLVITGAGWLFFLGLAKILDNPAPRNGAKVLTKLSKNIRKDDKDTKSFLKINPNTSAYVLYYLMLAGLIINGAHIVNGSPDMDRPIKKTERVIDKKEAIKESITEEIILDEGATYIMADQPNFTNNILDKYYAPIGLGVTELETYRKIPKRHVGESRETRGPGLTWTYSRDKNGKIIQKPNTSNTPVISHDENYEQLRMHLEAETIPISKSAIKGKMEEKLYIGLIWSGYQRPADMKRTANGIYRAKNRQQTADAFSYYGGAQKWKEGTLKRKWICAAYGVGVITLDDIKGMHRDAFSNVDINNIYRNGHFLLGEQTAKYVLSRTNKNETVEEFLKSFKGGRKILKDAKTSKDTHIVNGIEGSDKVSKTIEKSMQSMNDGDRDLKNKNYDGAAELYLAALYTDPDNMEAYSSLALVYKKIGDTKKSKDPYGAIVYYEKSADMVVRCNERMNANKSLLMDYVVKSASYYNGGGSRESVGDIYLAQDNLKMARENYYFALKNYDNALINYQNSEDPGTAKIAIYKKSKQKMLDAIKKIDAREKAETKIKTKSKFDSASAKTKQKSAPEKKQIPIKGRAR